MARHHIDLKVHPDHIESDLQLRKQAANKLNVSLERITGLRIEKRSIDARKQVMFQLRVLVFVDEPFEEESIFPIGFPAIGSRTVVVVGAGPAGLFAALRLLRQGVKPVIVERGKTVKERRRDLAAIFKEKVVDPESNYCFGEGGAGTYSDGKLYTRSKKRGDVRDVLETFVTHGASGEILVDAHPHIGTNKLPGIIENIRQTIIQNGGEVHFETRMEEILVKDGHAAGIRTNRGDFQAEAVILATGHSARDVFSMLQKSGIRIHGKPFALGVRIEHSQALIDSIQYKMKPRHENLPPSSYRLVTQADGRGVFSFCMCPGGIIAPAMTGPEEIVVNGWSPSKRGGKFANSGFVVEVKEEDWAQVEAPPGLQAMTFQAEIERRAFLAGKGELRAPAQRLIDFVRKQNSPDLPATSYIPGITPANMNDVLPQFIASRIRTGLQYFGKRMKDFLGRDAIMVGVESRTSSPVSIPRDRETLQHPEIKGLFPCGEGAGYAGGIVSAALDGYACADQAVLIKGNR